jgi:hypothetical protein
LENSQTIALRKSIDTVIDKGSSQQRQILAVLFVEALGLFQALVIPKL